MSNLSTNNPLIAAFAGEPALIDRHATARFEACLTAVSNHEHREVLMNERAAEGDGFWLAPDNWRAAYRPYIVDATGILQIPVRGVLLNNFPWQLGGWATGYEYIWRAFERGINDPQVRGIAFVCDSPGGMVAGNFDLVDKMYALRGKKPIAGFAHESAYSACYSIISVADPGNVYVSRTGGVGSIGVVTSHFDLSKMYDQIGIKVTWLFETDGKIDGNPTEPLSERATQRIMARIGKLYGVFVSTVARNRGMEVDAVKALKSFTYDADDATSNGLADKIGSLDDAMTAFCAALDDYYANDGDDEMTTQTTGGTVDQAAHETALAAARTDATVTATTAERDRIKGIRTCDEAKGRDALADHIAFNTNMTIEDAKGMLAASPKAADPAPAGGAAPAGADAATFNAAMDGTANPRVGVDGAQGGGQQGTETAGSADPILALVKAAGLPGFGATAK